MEILSRKATMTFIERFSDSAKNSLRRIHTLELHNYAAIFSTTHLGLRQLMSHAYTLGFFVYRYLLEQDFPGMRIGPEPTTDSFIAVMQGDVEGIVPGNALVVDPKKPFRKLNAFGNAFLNRSVLEILGALKNKART